jgi:hypothetical protein
MSERDIEKPPTEKFEIGATKIRPRRGEGRQQATNHLLSFAYGNRFNETDRAAKTRITAE